MKRRIKWLSKTVLMLAVISTVVAFALSRHGGFKSAESAHVSYVKRIVDGDTIVLANNQRVRYIGINTPETKHPQKPVEWMGREAASFNRNLVEHKFVRLEFDVELRDKYGRLLAYVYVGDTFVNAELLSEGYAQVFTVPPNVKYTDLFLRLEREAREKKKGLWGEAR